MVAAHICESCRGWPDALLPGLGPSKPDHCYGHADRPALAGMLGGYRCSCPCREWGQALDRASTDAATNEVSGE